MLLLPITAELLEAEGRGVAPLGEAIRASVASDWPPDLWEPAVRAYILAQLSAQPETTGWHRYILLKNGGNPILAGSVGAFPAATGEVELGYSVAGSCQRQGYASEAVDALSRWLLARPEVRSVSALAYEDSTASIKVMQRCGMLFAGPGNEPGTVRYRRWR